MQSLAVLSDIRSIRSDVPPILPNIPSVFSEILTILPNIPLVSPQILSVLPEVSGRGCGLRESRAHREQAGQKDGTTDVPTLCLHIVLLLWMAVWLIMKPRPVHVLHTPTHNLTPR